MSLFLVLIFHEKGHGLLELLDPLDELLAESLAAMSSDTKARVTVLENILRVPAKGEQLSVCDRLYALSVETTVIWNKISDQRYVVLISVEELAAALDA
nr:hypothetical protein CFP56_54214 [Quercus suber]